MNQRDKKQNLIRPTTLPGLPPSGSTGSALKTGRPFCTWLLAFLLAGLAAPSLAQDAPQSFAVPAQALSDALTEFADQADLKLVSDAALLRGLSSPGVSGTLTPAQGLERLLAGTGMRYRFVDTGTVTIEHAPKASPQPEPLAQATPPPKPKATILPEMTVTAKPTDATSYNVPNATTATKTDTPIMETPVSVQVVPQQVLKDQQVVRLEDVYKNVSGVQAGFGYQNFYDDAFIRGFPVNANIFRNGFRQQFYAYDTADLDRVEILKGPAAVLYGRIEPGGLINQVAKVPLPEPDYALQQQFGSYDFYRTSLDATGPLVDDRSLLYRFNLAYTNSSSFRDVELDRIFFAPTLSWKAGPDTDFYLSLNYQHQDTFLDEGIPGLGNRPADIPLDTQLCDPECGFKNDQVTLYFNWSHRIVDSWTVRNGLSTGWTSDFSTELGHSAVDPQTQTFSQFPWLYDENWAHYQTYLDLTGTIDVLGTKHSVLIGVDYYLRDFEQGFRGGVTLTQNIFDLKQDIFDFQAFKALGVNEFYPSREEWFGVYFQDQITLWDSLHILGGGRYDWASSKSGFSTISSDAAELTGSTNRRFSPRVGILYQPWPWLSLYGNYVESLGANNGGRAVGGKPFDPQTGEQYEAGVKTEFLDGQLSATLAYFHLTKKNSLTADLNNPGFSIAIGEAPE